MVLNSATRWWALRSTARGACAKRRSSSRRPCNPAARSRCSWCASRHRQPSCSGSSAAKRCVRAWRGTMREPFLRARVNRGATSRCDSLLPRLRAHPSGRRPARTCQRRSPRSNELSCFRVRLRSRQRRSGWRWHPPSAAARSAVWVDDGSPGVSCPDGAAGLGLRTVRPERERARGCHLPKKATVPSSREPGPGRGGSAASPGVK
jgi:hypothetical protein